MWSAWDLWFTTTTPVFSFTARFSSQWLASTQSSTTAIIACSTENLQLKWALVCGVICTASGGGGLGTRLVNDHKSQATTNVGTLLEAISSTNLRIPTSMHTHPRGFPCVSSVCVCCLGARWWGPLGWQTDCPIPAERAWWRTWLPRMEHQASEEELHQ